MSFIGSIPADTRKILVQYAREIKTPVLVIGAGNFTIPSVLRSAGYTGEISSCDVTLYTSILGAYLTGAEIDIAVKEDCPEHFRDMIDISSPLNTAATVSLLYDLRQVWKLKNRFQEREVENYRQQWPDLMEKTRAKLETYRKHIGNIEYQAKDGFKVLEEEQNPAHTVIAAPPIYKGDYEKLDQLLKTVFAWEQPEYRPILDKEVDIYRLIAKFDSYFVILYKDLPDVYRIIGEPSSIVMPRGRGANKLFIVTRNFSKNIIIRQHLKSDTVARPFPHDREITGRETLTMGQLSLRQTIRLNELYASARINTFTGGTNLSLAFFLDGLLIGKCDFCKSAHKWKLPNAPDDAAMIYLMSDLIVPHDTRKLAKLILLALLSRSVKELIDLRLMNDFTYVITTAFSARPASMKYRGLFKMHKRMTDPDGYRLNYYAPFMDHPLAEAMKIWKKRYGKTT